MARLIGPDEACRVVYLTSGSNRGKAAAQGMSVPLYADQALTVSADVRSTADAVISGSPPTMTVDAYSQIPLFKYPDGADTVYTSINGGPAVPLYARTDDRLDTLNTAVLAAQSTASGALVRAANLSDLGSVPSARANLFLGAALPAFGSVVDTALAGTACPVTGATSVLTLDRCVRAYVNVETQVNGSWALCTLTDTLTGAQTAAANGPGTYTFSTSGATQMRATGVVSQDSNSSWSGRLWTGVADVTRRGQYAPTPATPSFTTIPLLGRYGFIPHPTVANVVYGYAGSTVVKSVNGGAAYSTLFTAPAAVKRVARLASGKLLALCADGKAYLSDASEANFTVVHTVETSGSSASSSFGYDDYGSTVVYAEYGPNNLSDQARRAYQSDDGGSTWRKIFEGPQNLATGNTYHTHDVRYDPYEDLVWITNGDGPANANLQFRKRTTSGTGGWTKLWADGDSPLQWTTAIPLPSCVLFLSDNFMQSVWRYDRRTRGITNVTPSVGLAYIVEAYRTPELISTNPFVDRSGSVHVAYFGWTVNSGNSKVLNLWATADGLNVYPVWTSPRAPLNEGQADTFVGIFGVSPPDSTGRLLLDYQDRTLGNPNGNLVKLDRPTWNALP